MYDSTYGLMSHADTSLILAEPRTKLKSDDNKVFFFVIRNSFEQAFIYFHDFLQIKEK